MDREALVDDDAAEKAMMTIDEADIK